jgi:hypothetical protein
MPRCSTAPDGSDHASQTLIELVPSEQSFEECAALRELIQELLGPHHILRLVKYTAFLGAARARAGSPGGS